MAPLNPHKVVLRAQHPFCQGSHYSYWASMWTQVNLGFRVEAEARVHEEEDTAQGWWQMKRFTGSQLACPWCLTLVTCLSCGSCSHVGAHGKAVLGGEQLAV